MQINIQGLPVPESTASTERPAAVKSLSPIFTGGSREQSITELPAPVNNTNHAREQSITEPHTSLITHSQFYRCAHGPDETHQVAHSTIVYLK